MDISKILSDWSFEPGQVNARLVQGDDGDPKVQVRLDLGLIQMNWAGRPDGLKPNGFDSLLDFQEAQHDLWAVGQVSDGGRPDPAPDDAASPSPTAPTEGTDDPETPAPDAADDTDEEFLLSPEDCRLLRDEAVQYYHRYVALLVLEEYEAVIRDTTRNLRLLEFCAQHAKEDSDRTILEQFRPYIMMMRARALAGAALKDDQPKASVFALDESLAEIQKYFVDRGTPEMFEQSSEVEALRGMREALVPRLPVSQKSELRQRLQRALDQENYELAAILRDELRQIKDEK